MEISNPQVVGFANNRVRPTSDAIYSLYWALKSAHGEYFAQNIGTLINDAGASELIADGSETDGRPRITGGTIYNVVGVWEAIIAAIESDGRLGLIAGIEVNGVGG